MKIITCVIVLTYLIFQSVSDAKTMQVYTLPNNIAVFAGVLLYAWDCMRSGCFVSTSAVLVLVVIAVGYKLGTYGSGDMKAMIAIFFFLRYWHASYPHPDVCAFVFSIFVANVLFLIANAKQCAGIFKKDTNENKKKNKAAYFPYLTAGYVAGVALGFANYGLCV